MNQPISIALVNDFPLVVRGLQFMLEPFQDRIDVVELDTKAKVQAPVDIALFDTFGQDQASFETLKERLRQGAVRKVVLYTWGFDDRLKQRVLKAGMAGLLSKRLHPEELVQGLETIHAGRNLAPLQGSDDEDLDADHAPPRANWPGRSAGLTMREAEMLTLITQGLSNAEIAERAYLSPNSVKSYIRTAYRKVDVTRRSQAVAWGLRNGLVPMSTRRDVTNERPPGFNAQESG